MPVVVSSDPQEAEVARNEAGRRLVAASQRDVRDVHRSSRFATMTAAFGSLVFIPALAITLYLRVGAPDLPDDPLEARLNADPQAMDMATIIAKIERAVAKNPNDGRGWSLLARIYGRVGRTEDSVGAYRNEIRVLGPSGERLAGLGEAETAVNAGKVTAEAKKDFEQAAALDPKSFRARYYLGLAAEQDGKKTEAVTIWKQLVADSPPERAVGTDSTVAHRPLPVASWRQSPARVTVKPRWPRPSPRCRPISSRR